MSNVKIIVINKLISIAKSLADDNNWFDYAGQGVVLSSSPQRDAITCNLNSLPF